MMVPYDCIVGESRDMLLDQCLLNGRSVGAGGVPVMIVKFGSMTHNGAEYACRIVVSITNVMMDKLCIREESMLNETCPADMAFREVTIMGRDEPHTYSGEDYLITGLLFAATLNLVYQIYHYCITKRDD